MRTTKKQLEAKVAWLQRDVDDYYSRSKEWKKYADVMEAMLRLGEHHRSYQTLRTLADELRAAAEKPTTSSDIMAAQLEAVAPLVKEFYEKEDSLVSRFKQEPRDLRIPIRAVDKAVSDGMAEFRAAKDRVIFGGARGGGKTTTMAQVVADLKKRKISQPKSRPKSPPKRPARPRPT